MKSLYGKGICFITDRRYYSNIEESVRKVLDGGVRWIQLREKVLPRREIYSLAERIRRITWQYEALFIVNDYPDIAVASDADGVHLGQDDLPIEYARKVVKDKIIGISTHTLEEANEAQAKGADYVGFGPIFSTTTKENALPARGLDQLRLVSHKLTIPIVAIGGIRLENLRDVFFNGASAVAVASGLLCDDPKTMAERFVKIIKEELEDLSEK